jgi:hypothetical protein
MGAGLMATELQNVKGMLSMSFYRKYPGANTNFIFLTLVLLLALVPGTVVADFTGLTNSQASPAPHTVPEPEFAPSMCSTQIISRDMTLSHIGAFELSPPRELTVRHVTAFNEQGQVEEQTTHVSLDTRVDAVAYFGTNLAVDATSFVLFPGHLWEVDITSSTAVPSVAVISIEPVPATNPPVIHTLVISYSLGSDLPVTYLTTETLGDSVLLTHG